MLPPWAGTWVRVSLVRWDPLLPAIHPRAAAKGSVTLGDIHANWRRDSDKQAYF